MNDLETIETLLALLNPLHGELDRQTYDEKVKENFDTPADREWNVDITAQMERDLTQAVLILEDRRRTARDNTSAQRCIHGKVIPNEICETCPSELATAPTGPELIDVR